MLLPDYMESLHGISIPKFPSQGIEELSDILKKGSKHRFFGSVFQKLHNTPEYE